MEKKNTTQKPPIFFHLSPEDQLDKILSFIIYNDSSLVEDKDIMLNFDIYYIYLYEILDKLVLDGYVKKDNFKAFSITFRGRFFFLNKGGYKEQLKQEIFNNANSKFYKKQLLISTWFAGVVAFLLLLWQVFIYLYPGS